MKDMKKIFIQSCLDCGFIPSKKQVEAFDKKQWSISELDAYRKQYEEDRK